MEAALGVLGWSEDQFWSSTFIGFDLALTGWRKANVADKSKGDEDSLQELQQTTAYLKHKVPDGRPSGALAEASRKLKTQRKRGSKSAR